MGRKQPKLVVHSKFPLFGALQNSLDGNLRGVQCRVRPGADIAGDGAALIIEFSLEH